MNYYQGDPQPKRLDFSESKPMKTFIETQQKEARRIVETSVANLDDEGYAIREQDLDSLISQVVQRTVEEERKKSLAWCETAYMRGYEDARSCKGCEEVRNVLTDIPYCPMQPHTCKNATQVQSLLKEITSTTKSE